MKKQILIRVDEDLYGALLSESNARRMTVQQYIISILTGNHSTQERIKRDVGIIKESLYEERLSSLISYGYLKNYIELLDEKVSTLIKALPTATVLTQNEIRDLKAVLRDIEATTLSDVADGKDVFNLGRLYRLSHGADIGKSREKDNLYEEYDEDIEGEE